jgi:NAD(P)-dependent dehydrogenase (short-subunit alcohol dehydrogenase family)
MTTRVVIGAGSGMGRGVAERFAALTGAGDRLVLADKSASAVKSVAEGCGAEWVECNVATDAGLVALLESLPVVDAAVLTAGLSPTMGSGRDIFEVNLAGTARIAAALLNRVRPNGALVCFASTAGHMYPSNLLDPILDEPLAPDLYDQLEAAEPNVKDPSMAYIVSKHGVRRYVRRSAAAWGARQARIVSVSPGIIDTPMGNQEAAAQPLMAGMVTQTPLPRVGAADEVAAVACFLASPEASFVTGCDILVDGGFIATLG